jgi:hypothetical protein
MTTPQQDDMGSSVAEATSIAEARYSGRSTETHGQGSELGDRMAMPADGVMSATAPSGTETTELSSIPFPGL